MTFPPTAVVLAELAAATDRLLATANRLTAQEFAAPSLLPGWSRAHVLAHLALNAKGLAGVLTTVGGPDPLPMYASDARRDGDIGGLAAQPAARVADRVAVGAAVLAAHLGAGPDPQDALEAVAGAGDAAPAGRAEPAERAADEDTVMGAFEAAAREAHDALATWEIEGSFERVPGGAVMPAAQIPYMRWREVEIHHADLAVGYGPADWSAAFVGYLLPLAAGDRSGEIDAVLRVTDAAATASDTAAAEPGEIVLGAGGIEIAGSAAALAWWLIGRGGGQGLHTEGGTLPTLGPWVRRR